MFHCNNYIPTELIVAVFIVAVFYPTVTGIPFSAIGSTAYYPERELIAGDVITGRSSVSFVILRKFVIAQRHKIRYANMIYSVTRVFSLGYLRNWLQQVQCKPDEGERRLYDPCRLPTPSPWEQGQSISELWQFSGSRILIGWNLADKRIVFWYLPAFLQVVLNSLVGSWQSEMRTKIPSFVNGKIFKVG